MKLKAVYMSVGFLSGLLFAFYLDGGIATILAAVAVVLLLSLFMQSPIRAKVMLTCCCVLIGMSYSQLYTTLLLEPLEALNGKEVYFEGTVVSASSEDSGQVIINGTADGLPCKVVMYLSNFSGDIGDSISFIGEAEKLESGGLFDERSYYLPDGVYLSASLSEGLSISDVQRYSLITKLRRYSMYCSDKIREYAGSQSGAFLCAMTTGDTSYLSDSVKLALNRAGIGHITAVSGLHVGITCTFITLLLRKLKLSKRTAAFASALPIVVFVIFSGLKVSAIRAAIMMGVYLMSYIVNRKAHPLNTISVCTLIMAVANPYIIADASFVLSICGVFAASVFAPSICRALNVKGKLAASVLTAVCAWLGTLPALALYFDELSTVSVIANLILVPLGSVLLILTLIFVLTGCAPALAFLVKIAGAIAGLIIRCCEWITSFEFTYIPLLDDSIRVLLLVCAFAVIAVFLTMRRKPYAICSVLLAGAVFMGGYIYQASTFKDKLFLETVYNNGNCALLLHKNSECIIIDISSGVKVLGYCEDIMLEVGIKSIPVATVNKNGESAYTDYALLAITPDCLYLPEGTYIYHPEIEYKELGEITVIEFGGAQVTLLESGVYVSYGDESIAIVSGLASGSRVNISVFNGAVVVNGEELSGSGILKIDLDD